MEIIPENKLRLLNLQSIIKREGIAAGIEKSVERKSFLIPLLVYVSIPVFFWILWIFMFSVMPHLQETAFNLKPGFVHSDFADNSNPGSAKLLFMEENRIKKLDKFYAKFSNRQPYMIVNTSDNTFTLFNNGKLVREGLCSTGSFVMLDAGGEQKWMFETPKGMMRIQGKTESPIWRKPDWAFIEEGLPVPKHANSFERYERGVLGDYALSIGNGYLIHGTLYQRLLGMPVTHGCVRLGDDDLEQVFHTLRVGSKVYIF